MSNEFAVTHGCVIVYDHHAHLGTASEYAGRPVAHKEPSVHGYYLAIPY